MTTLSAQWITDPDTQAVCRMLTDQGTQALFVGGCVRNALLGAPVSDIDIATDAVPDAVMRWAKAAGLKPVPTGIDHGTVTVIANGTPHEVTTFRKDVQTDGRRAVVAFSKDVAEDAARRDFTMNALYATPDGALLDPLGGLPDLQARRVRFIGSAAERIREDYLRSLRFFRFHAWYGAIEAGMDPTALDAIARTLQGVATLSRERVGAEMLKLLAAPDPAPAVAAMRQTGLLQIVLPGADDTALAPLIHLWPEADALLRLAALGRDFTDALRLSKAEARRLAQLRDAAEGTQSPAALGYSLGVQEGQAVYALRAALLMLPVSEPDMEAIRRAAQQRFPLVAADLMPALSGPALGAMLRRLEGAWIASDFTLSKADLLALSKEG